MCHSESKESFTDLGLGSDLSTGVSLSQRKKAKIESAQICAKVVETESTLSSEVICRLTNVVVSKKVDKRASLTFPIPSAFSGEWVR